MKNKKYWTIWLCAFFAVFLFAGVMKMTVLAEAISQENVSVDYVYETVTVETTKDEVIYYTENYYADLSRWDACEVRDGKAVFDISWINEEKTVRLYLCGDVQKEVVSINLTWQEEFKVKFVGTLLVADITEVQAWKEAYKAYPKFTEDTGYFIFTLEENKRDNYYFDLDTIQWRKGDDGVWREFSELDLKEMNMRGIKLEFRIKAKNQEDTTNTRATTVLTNSGTRASSIAKATVAKSPNAPEIGVNTDIMTVEVRNGQEISLDKENWILIPTYSRRYGDEEYLVDKAQRDAAISEIYTSKRITGLLIQQVLGMNANAEMTKEELENGDFDFELDENGNKIGIIVYVRDAGIEKKAASLVKEVVVPFVDLTVAKADKADLIITYGESKTGNGGIVCENVSTKTYPNGEGVKYQIAILTPEEYAEYEAAGRLEDIDVSQLKWTNIKPGRTLKLANKKIEEGSYLLYRIAGEGGNLPSTYLISDEIRYDRITYIGFASTSKNTVGQTLEVVLSTNVKTENVTYEWQRYEPADANEVVDLEGNVDALKWEAIEITVDEDNNPATYQLTVDDAGCYIRVKVTDKNDTTNTKTSEVIGPIRAGN